MKKLLLFGILVTLLNACARDIKKEQNQNTPRYKMSEVAYDQEKNLFTLKNEGKALTGIIYREWENGKIKEEFEIKNGKQEGFSKGWYENGHLEFEGSMKDNKQEGITKKYYENGQLSYDGMYKEGKEDGVCKGWYENGQLWFKKNAKDGNPVGVQKKWHENGQLKWEGKFGELTSQKCWDKDGKEVECD